MSQLEFDEGPAETASEASYSESPIAEGNPGCHASGGPINGVLVGVLVGFKDDGRVPLVMFSGQRQSAALAARSTIDLHGSHIGGDLALMFEEGDSKRPIVMGFLGRPGGGRLPREGSRQVEVDADGERLVITAQEQLVLRCGKATITLTKAGKVLIEGTYVSSRSSGVNRLKGGSLQLN
jgi:hypothetical protein